MNVVGKREEKEGSSLARLRIGEGGRRGALGME